VTTALIALALFAAEASAPPAETIWTVPVGHSVGLLAGMRLGLSVIWPDAYDPRPFEESGDQFTRSWSRPPRYDGRRSLFESDGDPWTINVVGHGLFGAEVHGRVRACGGGFLSAVAFTTATSAVWEYGVEAFSQQPSALDLVLTPVLGALLGEARHQLQGWLRTRPPSGWRTFFRVVIDPLGEAERGWLRTPC
jgi:hypothetical protein